VTLKIAVNAGLAVQMLAFGESILIAEEEMFSWTKMALTVKRWKQQPIPRQTRPRRLSAALGSEP
jgi:hypothetical protein